MEPARHIATGAPEPTEIIARARAMIPTLAQRSLEGRRQRRTPDETIADMQRAGFFRVLQPKRWGGYEMDLHTFYEIQLALAEGDMSTAWIYGVSAHRSQSMLDNFLLKGPGQALNTSSLYRLPFGQIFVRGISTAALGALQGMLNAFLDYGKTRVTRAGGRSAENPFVQLLCAETAAAIDEMTNTLHRNFRNLHAYARRGEAPPLEERLRYKFQSTEVTERCTLLAPRIFNATGAAGLAEGPPFGGILTDLLAGRPHISNPYQHVGSSLGGVMFGLESKDLML